MRKTSIVMVTLGALAVIGCQGAPPKATVDRPVLESIPPEAAAAVLNEIVPLNQGEQDPTLRKYVPYCSFAADSYSPGGNMRSDYAKAYLFVSSGPKIPQASSTPTYIAYVRVSNTPVKGTLLSRVHSDRYYGAFLRPIGEDGGCLINYRWPKCTPLLGGCKYEPPDDMDEWVNRITTAWVSLGGKLGTP